MFSQILEIFELNFCYSSLYCCLNFLIFIVSKNKTEKQFTNVYRTIVIICFACYIKRACTENQVLYHPNLLLIQKLKILA